jgi:hypothetical protein
MNTYSRGGGILRQLNPTPSKKRPVSTNQQAIADAMHLLSRRRRILNCLAVSFGLDLLQAEKSFGHLLVQEALTIQNFIETLPDPTPATQQEKTFPTNASAASALPKLPPPEMTHQVNPWTTQNPAVPIQNHFPDQL